MGGCGRTITHPLPPLCLLRVSCGCGVPARLGPLERSSRNQSGGAACLDSPKRARGRRPAISVRLARRDFHSPQIAQRFGGQENFQGEPHVASLPLGLVGLLSSHVYCLAVLSWHGGSFVCSEPRAARGWRISAWGCHAVSSPPRFGWLVGGCAGAWGGDGSRAARHGLWGPCLLGARHGRASGGSR